MQVKGKTVYYNPLGKYKRWTYVLLLPTTPTNPLQYYQYTNQSHFLQCLWTHNCHAYAFSLFKYLTEQEQNNKLSLESRLSKPYNLNLDDIAGHINHLIELPLEILTLSSQRHYESRIKLRSLSLGLFPCNWLDKFFTYLMEGHYLFWLLSLMLSVSR